MKIIECNLLDADVQYIAHQCNCCSQGAKAIFDKYPDAAYPNQMKRNPGAISVHDDRIINCYAQWVAFPYKIGCGLAGGNWDVDYYPLLERFDSYCQSVGIEVILCKWEVKP